MTSRYQHHKKSGFLIKADTFIKNSSEMSEMYDSGENYKLRHVTILAPPHALMEYEYTLNDAKPGTHDFTIKNLFKVADAYLTVEPSESNPKERNVRVLYYNWEHKVATRWSWRRAHGVLLDKSCDELFKAQADVEQIRLESRNEETCIAEAEGSVAIANAKKNLADCIDRLTLPLSYNSFSPNFGMHEICQWYKKLQPCKVSDISVIYTMDHSEHNGPIKFIIKFIVADVRLKIGNTLTLNTKSERVCKLDQYYAVAQESGIHWVDTMFSISLDPKPDSPKISDDRTWSEPTRKGLKSEKFGDLTDFGASDLNTDQPFQKIWWFGPHTVFSDASCVAICNSQSSLEFFLVTYVVAETQVTINRLLFLNAGQINRERLRTARLVIDGTLQGSFESVAHVEVAGSPGFQVLRIDSGETITIADHTEKICLWNSNASGERRTREIAAVSNTAEPINLIVAQRLPRAAEADPKGEEVAPEGQFDDAILMFKDFINFTTSSSESGCECKPIWNGSTSTQITHKILQPWEHWSCCMTYTLDSNDQSGGLPTPHIVTTPETRVIGSSID